jgi:hypothetical protein
MKKYRELTRQEAKDLFSIGAEVESSHSWKETVEKDLSWTMWISTCSEWLEEDSINVDRYRIAVE